MRIANWMAAPLMVALVALPSRATAQVNLSVRFGTRLGPDVGVFAYSPERMGDWHANYRKWTPTTLYDINGHYYHNSVEGSRAVGVYAYNGQYFLPPTDHAWVGFDKRYNYDRRPLEADIGRARPYEPAVSVSAHLGSEIGVLGFSADRAGDWRKNYKRWTPTTVYEFNGRYYPHSAPGARAVQLYSYHDEYFLPPTDHAWMGYDKRFDYQHLPNDEDRRRMREHP